MHCAGGNTDFDRPAPTDLASLAASWRANLDANLLSAVLVTAVVRDRLTEGGTVVNIGSIAADKGAGAYGAAKAGVTSWNVELAAELGPRGVTANVVSPGYIADTEFFRDQLTAERREELVAATSTGRAGHPRRHCRRRLVPRLTRRQADHWTSSAGQRRRAQHPLTEAHAEADEACSRGSPPPRSGGRVLGPRWQAAATFRLGIV